LRLQESGRAGVAPVPAPVLIAAAREYSGAGEPPLFGPINSPV
jgi:hypothetical protein